MWLRPFVVWLNKAKRCSQERHLVPRNILQLPCEHTRNPSADPFCVWFTKRGHVAHVHPDCCEAEPLSYSPVLHHSSHTMIVEGECKDCEATGSLLKYVCPWALHLF